MAKTTHISFLPLNRCMENQTQTISLAVSDLIVLQRAIQVAAERGAFRAEEMSSVGQCYDKLSAWLAQMTPPPESGDAPQEPPQEEPKGE